MPLIMDEYDQDMEDLFGDSEPVHVQIAAASPVVKGLAERLDELAGVGCCQYETSALFSVTLSLTASLERFHGLDSEPLLLWTLTAMESMCTTTCAMLEPAHGISANLSLSLLVQILSASMRSST